MLMLNFHLKCKNILLILKSLYEDYLSSLIYSHIYWALDSTLGAREQKLIRNHPRLHGTFNDKEKERL